MWGITCYYNPSHYKRRYENFQTFRKNLKIPIIVVELAMNDEPFVIEVMNENNKEEIIVQVRSDSIMWHKERLLNIALSYLPKTCEKVCWMDCDIIFHCSEWVKKTEYALDRYDVVHPYEFIRYQNNKGQIEKEVRYLKNNMWGLCCAIRMEKLNEINGFYDGCIIGGGDNVFGVALGYGELNPLHYSEKHMEHINEYLNNRKNKTKARLGYIDGVITHLWHGTSKNRQYIERYEILKNLKFDPKEVIVGGENLKEPYRYRTDYLEKYNTILQKYFDSRKEDGK